MSKQIDTLVAQAVSTATVLSDGKPGDLEVAFDVVALKRLTTTITTPEKFLHARESAWECMVDAIRDRDMPRAQAAAVLRDRIERSDGRRYGDGPDGLRPLD